MHTQYFDKNSGHLVEATAPLAMARSTASVIVTGGLGGKHRLFITVSEYAAQL